MTVDFGTFAARPVGRLILGAGLLVIALLAAIALRSAPAVSSANWDVLVASGQVEWRGPDVKIGGWQAVRANDTLPDGAELRTGGDGTAIVAKGLDRIELSANTELVVAAGASSFANMEIHQNSGSAVYTVEKRPSGTFSVKTPYVVAVVKGTKFSVDIDSEETSVSVTEGRVGVSDRRSGESKDVTPGKTARSSKKSVGLGVGPTPAASKANPGAPKTGSNPNPSAKANSNASSRGNSTNAPGHTKEAGSAKGGKGKGNGGSNGKDNASDKGNGGGNGKGKGKDKDKDKDKDD